MNVALNPSSVDLPWSTAVPDWGDRIREGRSLLPMLPLHDAYADKALAIFKSLVVPDMEGLPTHGEVCEAWVFDFVRAVFGSYDPDAKRRYLREFFLMIPKKNGKTSIAAAIIVTAAILNTMPQAGLLLIAPTTIIAGTAYDQAVGIVTKTPEVCALFHPVPHEKKIKNLNPKIPSTISVKAADADVVTGSKAQYVLIDETHEFGKRPAAKGVFLEVRGGLSKPTNKGFLLQITTQSKTAPAGVFKAELKRAREVRDGKLRYPMLAVLYELPADMVADDGWKDPATWGLVNPNLDRSVSAEFLADELAKAEEDGMESLALLASQHFNVEIGTAQWGDGWPGARMWDGCALPGLTLETLIEQAEVCTIGVDWGGADDLASLVVIGRRASDKVWLHWSRSWARPTVFQQRKAIAPALEGFVKDGDLILVNLGEAQADQAADICERVFLSGKLPDEDGIGLDQAGIALLMDALEARGMKHPLVRSVPQTWALQGTHQGLPLKLESRRMLHAGQPIMSWAVGNAKQELKGNNYMVTKNVSGSAKIDPLMATFDAAWLMFNNPKAGGTPPTPWDLDPDYRMAS
jgi:phage terminase large subunit-like protein